MQHTERLLSITDLKKYYPLHGAGLFGRRPQYLRANEDITLEIRAGETFGLVGESGCGKSTLGRAILQLCEPTSGSVVYEGRSRAAFAPRYVLEILRHAERYHRRYERCRERVVAEGDAALIRAARVLGGFLIQGTRLGAALLAEEVRLEAKAAALTERITDEARRESDGTGHRAAVHIDLLCAERERVHRALTDVKRRLEAARATYRGDATFVRYEALRDDGIELTSLSHAEMRRLRRDLQIIFQDPYSALDPRMTVGQIIEEGLVTHGMLHHRSPEMRAYILSIMQKCGLQAYMIDRYPHQFSGGQRQRICIARALAVQPRFVVCDECVSALDVSIRAQIINLLTDLRESEGLTYLFISHDLAVVRYISDRIGVMYLGDLVEVAPAREIFTDPRHPYTLALLSAVPTTDPSLPNKNFIPLMGQSSDPARPPVGCRFHPRCPMAREICGVEAPTLREIMLAHRVACHFPDRKRGEDGTYLFPHGAGAMQTGREEGEM